MIFLLWVTNLGVVHMSVGEASKLKKKRDQVKLKERGDNLGVKFGIPSNKG